MKLRDLVGSGDNIALLTLPFLVMGIALNVAFRALFSVGGPPFGLQVLSTVVLVPGVIIWLWSAVLILDKVPKRELITTGPFALVRHPLYTAVALLVLPWIGFLLDTWLGAVIGAVLYAASRRFVPDEDSTLAITFGARWDAYRSSVLLPWL